VTEGTPRQRAQVQEGLAKWWHIAIYQFGPPEHLTKGRDWRKWRVKVDENETLRQQWISMLYPIVRSLGVEPDPNLERDPDTGEWRYSPLDWDRFFHLIRQRTPLEEWYVEEFKRSYENDQWALKALKELPLAA
jgi:ring-1,2-phenylacetyl-CoA epoxidase subunit PaaA